MTRLFSPGVFREMGKKGHSPLFRRLLEAANMGERCRGGATVGCAFDSAFNIIKVAGLRDEYVYRAALTHKKLMGTHSLNTACMLNEFRVGACKADLVILNGTATVYEIKSERDTLSRLRHQMENYQKVFASIYVIASESHVSGVAGCVPDDVGIMELSSRYQIKTIRKAEDRPDRVCPVAVFESLRSAEASAILASLGIAPPHVPNTQRHAAMKECFESLDATSVHLAMVRTLKRTRNLAPLSDLVERLPKSLHAAALSIPMRRADHDRVVKAVSTPLECAMAWA